MPLIDRLCHTPVSWYSERQVFGGGALIPVLRHLKACGAFRIHFKTLSERTIGIQLLGGLPIRNMQSLLIPRKRVALIGRNAQVEVCKGGGWLEEDLSRIWSSTYHDCSHSARP